jgi:hypothetical protein
VIDRADQIRTSVVHSLMGPLGASAPINAYGPRTEQVDLDHLVLEYQYREEDRRGGYADYVFRVSVRIDVTRQEIRGEAAI